MADIVLKDKNGNDIEYSGIMHVKIGNEVFSQATEKIDLHCYFYVPLGDSIRISKKVFAAGNESLWFTGLNENEMKEYGYQLTGGTWAVGILITKNGNLVEGEEYTTVEFS